MQLLQSWKDALKIFIPKNFVLFSLVSLNAMIKTYGVWLSLFWPLFLISFLSDLYVIAPFSVFGVSLSVSVLMSIFVKFLLFILLFLAIRPSVKRKNLSYFLDYKYQVALIGVIFVIKMLVYQKMGFLGVQLGDLLIISGFAPLSIVPLGIFMMFYFDSKGKFIDLIVAGLRMIKMLFFGAPFFLGIILVATLISLAIFLLFGLWVYPFIELFVSTTGLVSAVLLSLLKHCFILFSVVPLAFTVNFYTKKIYEQYDLYIGE